MTEPRVLVLDGEQRSALAVTRSLGAAGLRVDVGAAAEPCLASRSRHAAHTHTLPAPAQDAAGFAAAVEALCRQHDYALVIPVTDPSVTALLTHVDRGRVPLPLPAARVHAQLVDKGQALELGRQCGLDAPPSWHAREREDLCALAEEAGYPLIVKPVRSATLVDNRLRSHKVRRVASPAALSDFAREEWPPGGVLLQRVLRGEGRGVFVLCRHGEVLAQFAHRRLREKPPSGGVSVLCESAPVPAEVGAAVRKLVAAVGWHGVAMFEFKLDDEGRYCLMEVNGRFWGSLQLAIDAGVDFPRLLWAMSQGRTSAPHELGYRVGLRERWWLGDLDHLYLRLRHDSGLRARWQALRVFLAGGGPQVINEVRRPDDAAPFWFELRSWLRRLIHV